MGALDVERSRGGAGGAWGLLSAAALPRNYSYLDPETGAPFAHL
jgi:hypothetical protein